MAVSEQDGGARHRPRSGSRCVVSRSPSRLADPSPRQVYLALRTDCQANGPTTYKGHPNGYSTWLSPANAKRLPATLGMWITRPLANRLWVLLSRSAAWTR